MGLGKYQKKGKANGHPTFQSSGWGAVSWSENKQNRSVHLKECLTGQLSNTSSHLTTLTGEGNCVEGPDRGQVGVWTFSRLASQRRSQQKLRLIQGNPRDIFGS